MPPPETVSPDTKPPSTGSRLARTGVGGWLAVLIVILVVVRPVLEGAAQSVIFTLELQADPSLLHNVVWNRYRQIIWAVFVVSSLLSVSAGLLLWKLHRPVSVRYAMAVLWVIWPGSYIAVALVWLCLGNPLMALSAIVLEWHGLLVSLVAPLVWTLYLRYSKRVKNTYSYDEF
ncbi:DUF2569 family protein [Oxalobacter paraformigenes]|uniref:Transmembrane protein n=1 Tax=Oxalobacter paraformigenes TaxID=556268 RepID=C3X3B5_9BURK|nr:DUF2569 family protein [Oxalobacter paraformigenes]EEO27701.1 hypothetical protein OFAG_00854 [Oxalobacter paraformigenes]